jgi:ribonuclease HII
MCVKLRAAILARGMTKRTSAAERAGQERRRLERLLRLERALWRAGLTAVAGVDEVGVGPLAGPVVAAAVVFAPGTEIAGVDDSKRLSPRRREALAEIIRARATAIGIGIGSLEDIAQLNVYHAALEAMRRAVEALPQPPERVLVDARTIPGLAMPQNAYVKGDGLSFCIAAASIVAKTHRDRLMTELDGAYPGYGFAAHKGYDTPAHRAALARLGPCPAHRMSYRTVRDLCGARGPVG